MCLLISIFCGCLVLISHYQNVLINKLEFNEELINESKASFDYVLANLNTLNDDQSDLDIFASGITTSWTTKKWGFYNVLNTTTVFKRDTIFKSALIGTLTDRKEQLALFATDYDKPLKISGESIIIGDVKIPNGKLETGFINNKVKNKLSLQGKQLKSLDRIPKINETFSYDVFETEMLTLGDFDDNIIFNNFTDNTLIIDISDETVITNLTLKGNIILFSKSDLTIHENNTIEDILIVAPSITIASGFKGNMQIVSKKNVEVNSNVQLHYPSSIYVENDIDSVKVTIKENAKIAGGIVINGNTYNGSLKRQLTIDPHSTIIGDVYCYGKTQLKGQIKGTVYTDRFFLKTKSSTYENMIQNGDIDQNDLPDQFVRLPLFNTQNSNYAIVKEF